MPQIPESSWNFANLLLKMFVFSFTQMYATVNEVLNSLFDQVKKNASPTLIRWIQANLRPGKWNRVNLFVIRNVPDAPADGFDAPNTDPALPDSDGRVPGAACAHVRTERSRSDPQLHELSRDARLAPVVRGTQVPGRAALPQKVRHRVHPRRWPPSGTTPTFNLFSLFLFLFNSVSKWFDWNTDEII